MLTKESAQGRSVVELLTEKSDHLQVEAREDIAVRCALFAWLVVCLPGLGCCGNVGT